MIKLYKLNQLLVFKSFLWFQIRDCLDHSNAPMDGVTLSEGMHTRGINIRYLGKIANMLAKVKQLEYLLNIAVAELLTRSAKHVFTTYMQVSVYRNTSFLR